MKQKGNRQTKGAATAAPANPSEKARAPQGAPEADPAATCRVEALVSVDERGQMVLPKELRLKSGINAGDKFALTAWERDGRLCCLTLTKVEDLLEHVKVHLGPVMKDIL